MSPICQTREHDSVLLYSIKDRDCEVLPDPPATEVTNAAIELFAVTLPLQTAKIQESSVEQLATLLSAQSLNRNPGRRAAMTVNIAVALLHALRVTVGETTSAPGNMKNPATEKIIQELLQVRLELHNVCSSITNGHLDIYSSSGSAGPYYWF